MGTRGARATWAKERGDKHREGVFSTAPVVEFQKYHAPYVSSHCSTQSAPSPPASRSAMQKPASSASCPIRPSMTQSNGPDVSTTSVVRKFTLRGFRPRLPNPKMLAQQPQHRRMTRHPSKKRMGKRATPSSASQSMPKPVSCALLRGSDSGFVGAGLGTAWPSASGTRSSATKPASARSHISPAAIPLDVNVPLPPGTIFFFLPPPPPFG